MRPLGRKTGPIALEGGQLLRVVQQYKHLAVLLAATGGMDRELTRRAATAGATCSALTGGCLAK